MMKLRSRGLSGRLATGALVLLTAASPAAFAADAKDPVVARVNGTEIRMSEVDATRALLPEQYQAFPVEFLYPMLLDQTIGAVLVEQAGRKDGLADSEEVKRRLESAEAAIIRQVYVDRRLREVLTEEALRERYDEVVAAMPPTEEARISHILVDTKEEAQAILDEIKGGADFAALAKEKSNDPGSAPQGGDLGFQTANALVAPFSEVAFSLAPAAVAPEPVETQFGWHVIRMEEKRTAPPPTFEEIRPQLEQAESRRLTSGMLESLKAQAEIERFAPDGSPLAEEEPAPAATPAPSGDGEKPTQKKAE